MLRFVAALLLLIAVGSAQARPLALRDEPIDTVTVSGSATSPAVGKVELQAGQEYQLVVKGTATESSSVGSYTYDALYCVTNTVTSYGCALGGKQNRAADLEIRTGNAGPTYSVDAFEDADSPPTRSSCPSCPGPEPYRDDHTYTVPFYPTETGVLNAGPLGSYDVHHADFTSGSYTIQIFQAAQEPPPTCPLPSWLRHGTREVQAAQAGQRALAPNEVRVVSVCPDVQFHKGGSPADAWLPVERNTVLKAGDEVTCDPDGTATLAFADNSTVTVHNTTQLKIASFFTEGGVVRTEILLKMGEVAAQVNKSEATKSDFHIAPAGEIGTVRGGVMLRSGAAATNAGVSAQAGSELSVFYDPGSRTEIVDDYSGTTDVTPRGGSDVALGAGKEVAITPSSVSPIAPIGKADARDGLNPEAALDLVESKIGTEQAACSLETPHAPLFSVKPSGDGWIVSVDASAGKAKGWSTWSVAGSKVTPSNADAQSIDDGCMGGGGGTAPPNPTGDWLPPGASPGPPWHFAASGTGLTTLKATWEGSGTHAALRGSFTGQLGSGGSDTYTGTFTVDEGATHVTGTMSVHVVSSTSLVVSLKATGAASASTLTFTRTGA